MTTLDWSKAKLSDISHNSINDNKDTKPQQLFGSVGDITGDVEDVVKKAIKTVIDPVKDAVDFIEKQIKTILKIMFWMIFLLMMAATSYYSIPLISATITFSKIPLLGDMVGIISFILPLSIIFILFQIIDTIAKLIIPDGISINDLKSTYNTVIPSSTKRNIKWFIFSLFVFVILLLLYGAFKIITGDTSISIRIAVGTFYLLFSISIIYTIYNTQNFFGGFPF